MRRGRSIYSALEKFVRCPKCDQKTLVVDTRLPGSKGATSAMGRVAKVMNWYSTDWRARKRTCGACKSSFATVELPIEDFSAMLREVVVDPE